MERGRRAYQPGSYMHQGLWQYMGTLREKKSWTRCGHREQFHGRSEITKKEGDLIMKKVIISCAEGFAGSNVTKCFMENSVCFTALDTADVLHRLENNEKLTYFKCNLADSAGMMHLLQGHQECGITV